MNAPTLSRHSCKSFIETLFVAGVLTFSSTVVTAAPEDDVRLVFDQFVDAQNSHDVVAVRELLLDSPNFLWVTRGPQALRDALSGHLEALARHGESEGCPGK